MVHYFLELFAPRRVDPTEALTLTPVAGAPHAEPFRVTTHPSVSGWRPILRTPAGRSGRWDPLTKVVETGEMVCGVVDVRLGTSNADRWVTAFLGDYGGTPRPVGVRAVLSRSDDDGFTRERIFTGVVTSFTLDGRLQYRIAIRDMSERLKTPAFDARPYYGTPPGAAPGDALDDIAFAACLLPVRPPLPAPGVSSRRLALKVREHLQGRAICDVVGDRTAADNVLTRGLLTGVHFSMSAEGWVGQSQASQTQVGDNDGTAPLLERWDAATGGARSAYYTVTSVTAVGRGRPKRGAPGTTLMVTTLAIKPVDATDSLYAPLPAVGTELFAIVIPGVNGSASKDTPLVLRNVPVLRLMRWIAEGRFSRRLPAGSGARLAGVACDTAAFAAAESQWEPRPAMNLVVDSEKPIRETLEAMICRPYNLSYAFNARGELYPIETRFSGRIGSGTSPFVATLSDDDLIAATAPTWGLSVLDAIPGVRVKYRAIAQAVGADERMDVGAIVPAGALGAVVSTPRELIVLFDRYGETGTELHEVDAPGLGYFVTAQLAAGADQQPNGAMLDDAAGEAAVQLAARQTAESYREPFGQGVTSFAASYRRTANALAVTPGAFAMVTHAVVPDALTNRRGGTRVVQCISRTDGAASVDLEWLDLAANVVPAPPTLPGLSLDGSERTAPIMTLTVARNGVGHAVIVSICPTPTSVSSRPADNDPRWTWVARVAADGPITFSVPPAARIWVRAASAATADTGPTRWSAYVYAGGVGFDTDALLAPTGLAISELTSRRVVLSWAVPAGMSRALADVLAEVFPSAPGAGITPIVFETRAPGATSAELFLEPGQWYVVGVRFRTTDFRVSPSVTLAAFQALGAAPVAPACSLSVRA